MNTANTHISDILNLIDLRLLNTKNLEGCKVGFQPEDFEKHNLSKNDFHEVLNFLSEKGLLDNIVTMDMDETFEIEPGQYANYHLYPDNFPGIFVVDINKNYHSLKNELIHKLKNQSTTPRLKLADFEITFDDTKPMLLIGEKECPFPPFKNEHFLCREMFKIPKGEFTDWSLISQRMDKSEDIKLRSIQDTVYALNNRVKEVIGTDDNLLTWQNKSIKRNY